jgi:multidrug efflux pump subunit AcrB
VTFAGWIEHHRRSLTFAAFALTLAGIFAVTAMPVGLFPVVSFPRIRLEISSGSRPPRQQLLDVTAPVEQALREVPHALNVESTTSRGATEIYVDFPWGTDMQRAFLAIAGRMAQLLPSLPAGTTYKVVQMLPNVLMPFSAYSLTSPTVSEVALRRLAKYQIAPLLTGIPGVSHVGVLGGHRREVEVDVNPARLRSFGLTLADVTAAIAQANTLRAVGRLQDNDLLYLMISNNGFRDIGAIRAITLRTAQGSVVPLSDVATIKAGVVPRWYLVVDQGKPSVEFGIYQQANANSVALQRQVAARLATFMRAQPKSIHLVKWYDQTRLVQSSASAVEEAILIGLFLAALVLLGFLRNWRATVVAMLIVPMSMLITVLLLYALGTSFNIMTLGGLAAAVGLLIDDVIVMLEHIARRAGMPGLVAPEATVLEAAKEFLRPLTGSSLATIIIFVPLAFLSGVTGAFFRFLSLTMAASLVISYVLTAFVAPLLARLLIDFRAWQDPGHGRETRLQRAHRRLIEGLFRHPALIAAGIAAMLGIGYVGMIHVGTGFLPHMDEGGFVLNYQTAPGTSLDESNRELHQVEAILRADPDVVAFSRRTGAGLGGDLNEPNQGDFFVRLVAPSRRPGIWSVMDRVSRKVAADVPGLSFSTTQLMSDMIGDLVGRPQPVVVALSADDPAGLPAVARKVAARIATVAGVDPASVDDGVIPAGDALELHVDPATAALEGLTAQDVERQVNAYLHGEVVTRYLGRDQDIGVRVWLDPSRRHLRRRALGTLPIRSPNGHVVPLGALAKVAFVSGQPQLIRQNLQQVVPVTAQISGRSLGSTIAAIRRALAAPGLLPDGVRYQLGGLYKQQQIAFSGMVRVFVAALIAEVVLLLFLYESFVLPVIIVATSLLSAGAVFFGLWLTGIELDITALMGMVMILGIATEMAIFYVSEYQALAREMPPRQALVEAALNRLRPIAMSTLAMVLALLPLAVAIGGAGDQMQQPLAIAIISGIVVQLPLVLLAMPVMIGLTLRRSGAGHTAG